MKIGYNFKLTLRYESTGNETVTPVRLCRKTWEVINANARLPYPGSTVARLKLKRIGGITQTVEHVV